MNTSALFFFFSLFPPQWGPIAQKKEQIEVLQVGNLREQLIIVETRGPALGGVLGFSYGGTVWGMAVRGVRYGHMDREGA